MSINRVIESAVISSQQCLFSGRVILSPSQSQSHADQQHDTVWTFPTETEAVEPSIIVLDISERTYLINVPTYPVVQRLRRTR